MTRMSGSPISVPRRPPEYVMPDGWAYEEITLVGTDAKTGGSWSFTNPGTRAGDIAVVAACTRNSSLGTPSAGSGTAWSVVYYGDTSSSEYTGCWAKVCNASEPATYSQSLSGTGSGVLAVFRRASRPFNYVTWVGGQDNGSTLTPTIATTQDHVGGIYIAAWTSCYNGGGNSGNVELSGAAYIKQSTDELSKIAYKPIYFVQPTGYLGTYYNSLGDGGYRSTGSIIGY